MNKKIVGGIVALLVVLAVGGLFWKLRAKPEVQSETPTQTKKKVVQPVNVIPVVERPYVQVYPKADGRNVEISVIALNKPATTTEYELEYQSGSLLQGAFGLIELGALPTSTTILLGSCSAGGACTYHQDVQGGTLLLKMDGTDPYAVKSDWRYHENTAKDTLISSRDGKFTLENPAIGRVGYSIIYNSPGFPEAPTGTLVSDLYAVATSSTLAGESSISIRASEAGSLVLQAWDGSQWIVLESSIDADDDKVITATADELYQLYAVTQ